MKRKFLKKAVALMVVCGVMFASVAKVEAGTQLGSASKAYPSDKGYVTVLSDGGNGARYFMKGSISYKTKSNLSIQASGYYRTMYGDVYKVSTPLAQSGSKTTALISDRAYASTQDVPVCNSTYPNKAVGKSSIGGSLTVTRK